MSLLPMLRGEPVTRDVPVVHHSSGGIFAIRGRGSWCWATVRGGQEPRGEPFGRPYQLFDLSRDPAEARDVAADYPEVVERLEATLERFPAHRPERAAV